MGKVFNFDNFYKNLLEYKKKYDDLLVPQKYITSNGVKLGLQVRCVRCGNIKTTDAQKELLDSIDFVWDAKSFDFDGFYRNLVKYKKESGDLLVPQNYTTNDGVKLGVQVSSIRAGAVKTTDTQKELLDSIGFVWDAKSFDFDGFYKNLVKYKKANGNLAVPVKYVTDDGHLLGQVVSTVRLGNHIKLTKNQKEKLDKIGFVWKMRDYSLDMFCKHLLEYKEELGHARVPIKYVAEDGYRLGRQGCVIRRGRIVLTESDRKKLDEIGFIWDIKKTTDADNTTSATAKNETESE